MESWNDRRVPAKKKIRALLRKLSSVDLVGLSHQQRLAFWINTQLLHDERKLLLSLRIVATPSCFLNSLHLHSILGIFPFSIMDRFHFGD